MTTLSLRRAGLALMVGALFIAPGIRTAAAQTPAPQPTAPKTGPHDTITTKSGLRYVFKHHGTGARARAAQTVTVHYVGTLRSGKKFDSSRDRKEPFEFVLGAHQVIAGWDEGIALLHVGDRVMLIIPPKLGYGVAGHPPEIPANSTLLFDVELLGVRGG